MKRIYTFGSGQPNYPGYVVVYGVDDNDCRGKMNAAYQRRWSMEYRDESDLHPADRRLITVIGEPSA